MFLKLKWFTGLWCVLFSFSVVLAETLWIYPFSAANQDTAEIGLSQEVPELLADEFEKLGKYQIFRKQSALTTVSQTAQNSKKTDGIIISGKWMALGRFIRLNTQVFDAISGVLVTEYASRLQSVDYLPGLKGEVASLAAQIHQDLMERKTPFGYPFHDADYGILYCDFRTSLNRANNDIFWRELTDSLVNLSQKQRFSQIKFKRISRNEIDSLVVSPFNNTQSLVRLLGGELNARMVLWSEVGRNQRIRFYLTHTDTLFELPAIKQAQLAPFAIARELNVINFPETNWHNRHWMFSFVVANVLFQHQKYASTLSRLQLLARNDWFPYFFYSGNSSLLNANKLRHQQAAANGALNQAAVFYRTALQVVEEPAAQSMVFNNLGVLKQLQGQADSALVCFKKSVEVAQQNDLKSARIRAYHNLANVFLIKREWEKALKTYRAGLSLVDTAKNKRAAAILLDNLGILNQRLKNENTAIENLEQSLALKQQTGSTGEIAQTYFYLGSAYQAKNKLDRALEYYLLSLDENLKLKNDLQVARMYAHIGRLHWLKGELNMALEYYLKRAELMQYLGNERKLLETDLVIAEIHWKKGELVAALDYLTRARALAEALNDSSAKAHVLDKTGDILNAQSRYDEALSAFGEAVRLFEKNRQIERMTLAMFNMGLIQVKQKNYQAGYDLMQAALAKEKAAGLSNLKKEKPFLQQLATIIEKLKP